MTSEYLERYGESGLFLMQGRLSSPEDGRFQSFPRSNWLSEIKVASQVPLRGIEWIYDLYGEDINPLNTPEDRANLKNLLEQSGVIVKSICADYFMDCPIVSCEPQVSALRLDKLLWLISICPEMGINRIVLPFVDHSRMTSKHDERTVIIFLEKALPWAAQANVELHLETDLAPVKFSEFLKMLDHPLVKVNYDSGNSAGLGFKPAEEFAAYGERIGSFHIKDRLHNGGSVPLGLGDTDFFSLRKALIDINYSGDFVMQVARGNAGEEFAWLQKQSLLACDWLRGKHIIGK